MEYYRLSDYFRTVFGEPVRKVSVDAHFSCPNIDGTLGRGGCIFCNNRSFSPARRRELPTVTEQLNDGVARLSARYGTQKFIAYFQPSTNTYAPVERLAELYGEALKQEKIVGLAIGTRPDSLPEETLDLLAEISRKTWLSLEIGIQTIHDSSLKFLNRGHDFAAIDDAIQRARRRRLRLAAHIILGLPNETADDQIATADYIAAQNFHSVKLHNLYVVQNTPLARMWTEGKITLPTLEEYAERAVDFLERLSPQTVIERLAGDAPRAFLLAPEWSGRKNAAQTAVLAEFRRRGSFQGRLFSAEK